MLNYPFLTQKERDVETGLDYFEARYYASTQGRFTSVDPLLASAKRRNPQTWNRYTYGMNNPLRFTDPDGEDAVDENDLEVRRTTTTTEVIVQDQDRRGNIIQQAKVTVTETKTEFLNADGQVDSSVDPITVTTATAVNTGNGAREYSLDQLKTMANVAQNVVAVSREKLFDPTIALGVANTETRLGTSPPGETAAHKQPNINPMQLSATSGTTATTDLRSNIAGSIDVFNRSSASTNTLNQRLQAYNNESIKVAYANKAERQINQIRQSVKTKMLSKGRALDRLSNNEHAQSTFVVLNSHLIKTDDQGETWHEVSTSAKHIFWMAFSVDGTGWLVGNRGIFQQSSDGGKTWQSASLPSEFANRDWEAIAFNSSGIGLAVGENSTLALTTDNGKTWEMQTVVKADHLPAVRMQDSRVVILGAQNVYSIEVSPANAQQASSK